MIKIVLDVDDTLEITEHDRLYLRASTSGRLSSAINFRIVR
jgi:hypothetical protein